MLQMTRFCLLLLLLPVLKIQAQEISLAGTWQYRLDPLYKGIEEQWYQKTFSNTLRLPGTLDDNKIGETPSITADTLSKEVLLNLTRKHRYVGAAWYRKEVVIPAGWRNKDIHLYLERVIWQTRVWIDGKETGLQESLSTPQYFDVTAALQPGKHTLVLRIDNSRQYDISLAERNFAHAYTDGTQIIWNGVIGQLLLKATNKIKLNKVQVYPDVSNKTIRVTTTTINNAGQATNGKVQYEIWYKNKLVVSQQKPIEFTPGAGSIDESIVIPQLKLWDEFNPNLYQLKVTLSNNNAITDEQTISFGMRQLTHTNGLLQLNGRRLFLRGTLECNIFPLTGYPPMDKKAWVKVFAAARQYGLNHLRFHSWCPPKAAFEVADSLGFYLQIENPLWILNVGADKTVNDYIRDEANRIGHEYGNHPSFCFWSMGNELQGDFDFLKDLVVSLRSKDQRHLYSTTSFTFMKGHGRWPEPEDDFYVTQWTKKGWVRGQGIFNDFAPEFNKDYTASIDSLPVPVITHEIGQYSVYPDMNEIKKYTGVLDPLNFKAIRKDLQRKDLLPVSSKYTNTSGALAANLYKEEIERALKTNGASGFQLLDLHDFPGQGTALVGLLDAFWESKGVITAEAFRKFCAPVVPLIRFSKATYTTDEKFTATTEIANFSNKDLVKPVIDWAITDKKGRSVKTGSFHPSVVPIGNGKIIGTIEYDWQGIDKATELLIKVAVKGTSYQNSWSVWVYPVATPVVPPSIVVTNSLEEAQHLLRDGKTVLLNPDTANLRGVEGRFAPVFWSPVHFPNQPGTMGLLLDAAHPAFAHFPTNNFTNWQWWDLIKRSKTMVIDSCYRHCTPLVTMIDNFFKNRRMANLIEAKYSNGKLMIVSMDITHQLDQRPAARQLRYSLLKYMSSQQFNPAGVLTEDDLKRLVK